MKGKAQENIAIYDVVGSESIRGFDKEMKDEEGIEEGWKSYRRKDILKGMREQRNVTEVLCRKKKKMV